MRGINLVVSVGFVSLLGLMGQRAAEASCAGLKGRSLVDCKRAEREMIQHRLKGVREVPLVRILSPTDITPQHINVPVRNDFTQDVLVEADCDGFAVLEVRQGDQWKRLSSAPNKEQHCPRKLIAIGFEQQQWIKIEHRNIYSRSQPPLVEGTYRLALRYLTRLVRKGRESQAVWVYSEPFQLN
ncbi:MAG: hypothetical protein H6624_15735 [Bdellovibrionaceae bacterium]|nr:hypothetical protein [Bdellovibrionales bacterium]MCB9085798.1 hypothetical protein [Pseudobdellovibrionaceae bacterium]